MNQIIRLKHIVIAFYIVLMAVQIIALEGFGVSPIKVIAMLFAPALMFIWKYTNTVSIIFVYAGVYILLMIVCCAIGGSLVGLNMSWERIGYRTMYLMMFLLIYSIIYEDIIDIRFIRNVLKFLLLAYGLTFIFQHLFFVIGIREVPIINFYGKVTMLGIFKPNGLFCEPSHSARILTILYWGYLTLTEIINGTPINFKHTWTNHTYVTISFWFSMITMGSALAMIGCILILCTFFKRNISLLKFRKCPNDVIKKAKGV